MFTQDEDETFEDMLEQSGDDIMVIPKEREVFIERIVSDFRFPYSFWVSIDVESPAYKGKAVIENHNLIDYFRQFQSTDRKNREKELDRLLKKNKEKYIKEGFNREMNLMYEKDQEEYKKIMFRMLRNKPILKIKKEGDFAKYDFFKVPNNETIAADAQKGVDHFIKTYIRQEGTFGEKAFKRDFTIEEQYAIISQLYDFNIAVMRNCETGYFLIYYITGELDEVTNIISYEE
jgi:hypothetical protein